MLLLMRQHWGGIIKISQCQSFYLAWAIHYDPRCAVRFWRRQYYHVNCHLLESYASIYWSWCFLYTIHWAVCHDFWTWQRSWSWSWFWRMRMWIRWRWTWILWRQTDASEKGPQQCRHCGRSNHISEKCWEWAQLSDSATPAPCCTHQSSSSAISGSFTVVLLQEEYDRLRQLEFSQNDLLTTHPSASDMRAYTASPQKPWILDWRASSHMTSIK